MPSRPLRTLSAEVRTRSAAAQRTLRGMPKVRRSDVHGVVGELIRGALHLERAARGANSNELTTKS